MIYGGPPFSSLLLIVLILCAMFSLGKLSFDVHCIPRLVNESDKCTYHSCILCSAAATSDIFAGKGGGNIRKKKEAMQIL
jgi:hypothetical protein